MCVEDVEGKVKSCSESEVSNYRQNHVFRAEKAMSSSLHMTGQDVEPSSHQDTEKNEKKKNAVLGLKSFIMAAC